MNLSPADSMFIELEADPTEPFNNPNAATWVNDLTETDALAMVTQAIENLVVDEEIDLVAAQEAVAAATLMAVSVDPESGVGGESTPAIITELAAGLAPELDEEIITAGQRALTVLAAGNNELAHYWEEDNQLDQWLESVRSIGEILAG